MSSFIIPIPNDKAYVYRIVNFIILILNFFVFGVVFMKSGVKSLDFIAIAGMVINGVPAIYYLLNKRHFPSPFLQIFFLFNAILWLVAGSWTLAFLMLGLAVLSFIAQRPLNIIFNEQGIRYPSFPLKKYEWREVENVIWKDDVLTIDLKSNQLMQFTINTHNMRPVNVELFNEEIKKYIIKSMLSASDGPGSEV